MDEKTFSHRADTAIAKAGAFSAELQTHLQDIVAAHSHYFGIAAKVDGPGRIDATRDVHAQLQRLVHRRFLSVTPPSKMGDIARFIRAAARRLEKLDRDARTDSARLSEVLGVEEPVFKRIRSAGRYWRRNSALVEVRWMLEELRVSVFAQDLGTRQSVSVKRITRALDAIG